MQARAACAALAALATVLACASPAQRERYRSGREALARAEAAHVASAEDPFAGQATLSRRALIALVLARNPDIDAAREAWRAALARWPQETALPDPMLGYGVRPRSFGSDEVKDSHDVELAVPLPFPGKLGLRGEAALAEAAAAGEGLAEARLRLATLASTLFDDLWLAERALDTTRAHLVLLEELQRSALAQYAAGVGSQPDVLAAETEHAMLLHREIELEAEQRIVSARLNTLLRRAPELALPPAPRELEPPPGHDFERTALVERALADRPDRLAQAEQIRAREAQASLARLEFLPDFTLRGMYEGTWQETALKPFVGIELNLPLQLGRRRAALDEANARLALARSRGERLEDRVRFEVTSALERVFEAQHLLELTAERIVPAARDRVAATRAAYESGGARLLEVVDAERSLLTAELAAHDARAALSRRNTELGRALGATPLEEDRP